MEEWQQSKPAAKTRAAPGKRRSTASARRMPRIWTKRCWKMPSGGVICRLPK